MFQPAVAIGGYAGWKIFDRGATRQLQAFENQESVQRELAYFSEKISLISSPEQLIRDRRLLHIALGAFGLDSEIDKKAIIRRVLEEDVGDPGSFANRMNDLRWRSFAASFSAENLKSGRLKLMSVRDSVAERYVERAFEKAVGDADPDFRLAMNFRREVKAIASGVNADRVGWLQIMGQRPIRTVIEAAFGLPASTANLDIDRQRLIFERKSEGLFGVRSASAFLDDANVELALRRFFTKAGAQADASAGVRNAAVISLIAGSPLSAGAQIGRIISNSSAIGLR